MSAPFIKLSFHNETGEHHTYLPTSNTTELSNVMKAFENIQLLVNRRHSPMKVNVYWLDNDLDRIYFFDPHTFKTFLRLHQGILQLHGRIEGPETKPFCNHCNRKPIIGYRYMCIQCKRYNLCPECEALHVHATHVLVRLPQVNYSMEKLLTVMHSFRKVQEKSLK